MINILISGANGQLGQQLKLVATNYPQINFIFTSQKQLNFSNLTQLASQLKQFSQIDFFINTAAYTAVDQAEQQPQLANTVNHLAVKLITNWCALHNIKLIQISTDYVFSQARQPITENTPTQPINQYGYTKLLAEQAILQSTTHAIILRTSWLHSTFKNNFVLKILQKMNQQSSIKVVDDQIGSPTYALDLANALISIVLGNIFPTQPSIYHYANLGTTSWFGLAEYIAKQVKYNGQLIASKTNGINMAQRPKYSALNSSKIANQFNLSIPSWQQGVQRCLAELKHYA